MEVKLKIEVVFISYKYKHEAEFESDDYICWIYVSVNVRPPGLYWEMSVLLFWRLWPDVSGVCFSLTVWLRPQENWAQLRLCGFSPSAAQTAAAPGQTPEITVRTGPSRTEPSRDRTQTDGLVSSRRAEPASVTGKNRFIWPTAVYVRVCVCVSVRERERVCARATPLQSQL